MTELDARILIQIIDEFKRQMNLMSKNDKKHFSRFQLRILSEILDDIREQVIEIAKLH